ncbi:MAG TPA: hypothetical protein VGK19_15005 [Capsulimonadaceae bacterium]|jgi:hypothetical protein
MPQEFNETTTSTEPIDGELTPIEVAAEDEAGAEDAISRAESSLSPVAVFEASTSTQGEILKGVLQADGIDAVFESLPGITMVLGGDFQGTVFVPAEDEARARELIASFTSAGEVTDEDVALSDQSATV